MKNSYYDMLNEGFNKLLLEAQQVVIDFKNIFGNDVYDRYKSQKQRMSSPENDISYWVRKHNEEGDSVIDELDSFISNLEDRKTRREKREIAEEGAELVYEDDDWLVYHITSYEAACKYGSHTRWCITGRYEGREDEGKSFFDRYLANEYSDYYFFIKKGNDNEKYAVCVLKDGEGYDIWDPRDGRPGYVPNGPTNVPGLPDLPVEPNSNYDYDLDTEEDDFEDEEEEDEEPVDITWTDEEGSRWSRRPPMPQDPEMIDVEDPTSFEFSANSKEEAISKFSEKGFEGVEFIEDIPNTPVSIIKFMVEPSHEILHDVHRLDDEGNDTGEIYERVLPGERYTAFVFFPGQGGGPLLTQDGKIIASRTLDGAKAPFIRDFQADNIHRQGEEPEPREESLKEGFYYYDFKVEEACKLKEDKCNFYTIWVGEEPIEDIDGKPMHFKTELEANTHALQELELLQGDYEIRCDNSDEVVVG